MKRKKFWFEIDCSSYCDGQGAFKNGMHDARARIRSSDNLYRSGRWNRALWLFGHLFNRVFPLAYVAPLPDIGRGRTDWNDAATLCKFQQQATAAERDLKRRLHEHLNPQPVRATDSQWPPGEALPKGAVCAIPFENFAQRMQSIVPDTVTSYDSISSDSLWGESNPSDSRNGDSGGGGSD